MEKLAWLPILLALVAGCVMALQPAVNGTLAGQCEHPLQASIISFATGLLALLLVAATMRIGVPSLAKLSALPLWAWTGGLIGTYMVTVSLLVAPKLGAARWIALVLAGQIGLSLVMDHFGWLGFRQQPINWLRCVGAICLWLGIHLVLRH